MHIFFYVRGINQQVELFKTLAQGQFWRWTRKNLKTGKMEDSLMQGGLRPSVLGAWEYIFPEECLADVIAVFGFSDGSEKDFRIKALRKIFGAKKIPKEIWVKAKEIKPSFIIDGTNRGLSKVRVDGADLHLIGIKKDVRKGNADWGYEQEML